MNIEDFDNEQSSDDEDFCPEKHQQQSASENSGIDDEPVDSDEARDTGKTTKRKKKIQRGRKSKPASVEEGKDDTEKAVDPEEEKRKADAIWADFLSSTDSPLDPEPAKPISRPTSTATTSKPIIPTPAPVAKQIFEFAGETVEIPAKQETPTTPTAKPPTPGFKRSSGGGLSSVLNQLSKKNKLSVLEKTKLDWDGFKSKEGISEELQTHNRGREGFLERRDFLERTDLRQFQIEKDLRHTRRK